MHGTAVETDSETAAPLFLSPFTLRGMEVKNRCVVSPMCMYSASDGLADDFHLAHIGRFALGGAGLVFVEATAVSERGRITHGCLGLWSDAQIAPLARIAGLLHRLDCKAGIQLSHSGYKGSTQRPWEGMGPLGETDAAARGEAPWNVQGVTGDPFDSGWAVPEAIGPDDLEEIAEAFVQAARRADTAGFDIVEVHCAHGYLLHSFLSPLANTRSDAYGGDLEGRMRFPLEVVRRVRAAWPAAKPISVRISSVDGVDVGWSLDESIVFAKRLKALGVDVIDCSSGGMKLERQQNLPARTPGFHLPYAEAVRREAEIPVIAVGLIRTPHLAEEILQSGKADLIAVAREALFQPNWANQTALELAGGTAWDLWPEQFGWWLKRRARQQKDSYGPDREEKA